MQQLLTSTWSVACPFQYFDLLTPDILSHLPDTWYLHVMYCSCWIRKNTYGSPCKVYHFNEKKRIKSGNNSQKNVWSRSRHRLKRILGSDTFKQIWLSTIKNFQLIKEVMNSYVIWVSHTYLWVTLDLESEPCHDFEQVFFVPSNVHVEPVFSVLVAGWFCEKSGWIWKVEDVKQGLGDFWAQPAKIRPFTTTGSLRIWPVPNLLPFIWTG